MYLLFLLNPQLREILRVMESGSRLTSSEPTWELAQTDDTTDPSHTPQDWPWRDRQRQWTDSSRPYRRNRWTSTTQRNSCFGWGEYYRCHRCRDLVLFVDGTSTHWLDAFSPLLGLSNPSRGPEDGCSGDFLGSRRDRHSTGHWGRDSTSCRDWDLNLCRYRKSIFYRV